MTARELVRIVSLADPNAIVMIETDNGEMPLVNITRGPPTGPHDDETILVSAFLI